MTKKKKDAVASENVYSGIRINQLQNKDDMFMALSALIPNENTYKNTVFLCIGTDRSTGDSLAPLVGTYLKGLGYRNVYGTIDEPVHAMNLQETIKRLPKKKQVIAIDACMGQLSSVGTLQLVKGSMKPGAGVNKELPEVGDYSIMGVVNIGGFMEYFVLQNTRLSLVMKMAKEITSALTKRFPLDCENNPQKQEMMNDKEMVSKLKKMGLKADLIEKPNKMDLYIDQLIESEKRMELVLEKVK